MGHLPARSVDRGPLPFDFAQGRLERARTGKALCAFLNTRSALEKGMKILATMIVLGAVWTSPAFAAGPNDKRLSMEQRIQDTEIGIGLKHYETVRTELANARLKQELAQAEALGTLAEREAQAKLLALKIELLERYAKMLRDDLLKAGQLAARN